MHTMSMALEILPDAFLQRQHKVMQLHIGSGLSSFCLSLISVIFRSFASKCKEKGETPLDDNNTTCMIRFQAGIARFTGNVCKIPARQIKQDIFLVL